MDKKTEDFNNLLKNISKMGNNTVTNLGKSITEMYKPITLVLNSIKNNQMDALTKSISESIAPLRDTLLELSKQINEKSFINLSKYIEEIVSRIPKIEITPEIEERIRKLRALSILGEYQWPLFLYINDNDLISTLEGRNINDTDSNLIEEICLDYCTNDFIDAIYKKWKTCKLLDPDRKEIIIRSIDRFYNNDYISCVSILSCQVDGIISDMDVLKNDLINKENNVDQNEMISFLLKKDISMIDFNREKERFMAAVYIMEEQPIFIYEIIKYIYEVVYLSGENKNTNNNLCRNKICHGEQVDFNNRICAIKSILTIDILIYILNNVNQ